MKFFSDFPEITLFALGAIGYPLIELLWRGRTHWTMAVAGGICMVLLLKISRLPLAHPLLWLLSAIAITTVEFTIGCVVNRWLHWQVWDYSQLPLNLLGQISLPFSLIWYLLSIPGIALCRFIDHGLLR